MIVEIIRDYKAFQSTRPVRGATSYALMVISFILFQSTRPVRGATSVTMT